MKDPVFSGVSLEDALASASAALQMAPGRLRYLVLEPGSGDTTVRIAVLLDVTRGSHPAPSGEVSSREPAGLGSVLQAIGAACAAEIEVTEHREGSRFTLRLSGPGAALFVREGGQLLRAAELLLQRMADREHQAPHVVLECAGYREERDAWLMRRVRELAAAVVQEGRAREMEPLNAYERRVVHMTAAEAGGVRSFSVGSGADRRVTLAPVEGREPEPADARGR